MRSQDPPEPVPIACNPNAIAPAERAHYRQLVNRLRAAIRDRAEIDNGFHYHLDSASITLPELAEWIALERLCCPFLTFHLSVSAEPDWRLSLAGPPGVKPLLDAEFRAGAPQ